MEGPRRKRARVDKGLAGSGRHQRTATRTLVVGPAIQDEMPVAEASTSALHAISDAEPPGPPQDGEWPIVSRTNSVQGDEPSEPAAKRPRRPLKGKGKGKEVDGTAVKVKEEPGMAALGGDPVQSLSNQDHCSACRSLGTLVYCDGCPRAFHVMCLDPPIEGGDLREGERWFCPACQIEQRPPPKTPADLKFMAPLIHELYMRMPVEYQLPPDIRTHFKDVATGAKGQYIDSSEVKQPRLNRHGQLEDRDPYRLRDRNGEPILCFGCGKSALPPGVAADSPAAKRARRATSSCSSTPEAGRSIISCDYCHLHWHLDCLTPPMVFMPHWGKKWMCPNHAERVLQPKRRIPRANATPIDITTPHQWNNGNIDVIGMNVAPLAPVIPPKMNVEEVLINGRRYRVPEKVIQLDFWDKVGRKPPARYAGEEEEEDEVATSSRGSSPLTSLSSLSSEDSWPTLAEPKPGVYTLDDVKFAQLLCGMSLARRLGGQPRGRVAQNPAVPAPPAKSNGKGKEPAEKMHTRENLRDTSGRFTKEPTIPPKDAAGGQAVSPPTESASASGSKLNGTRPKRTRPQVPRAPRPPTARRSARHTTTEVPMDVDAPEVITAPSVASAPPIHIKTEPIAQAIPAEPTSISAAAPNGVPSTSDQPTAPKSTSARPKRNRLPAKRAMSPVALTAPRTEEPRPDVPPNDSILHPSLSTVTARRNLPPPSSSARKRPNGTPKEDATPRRPATPPAAESPPKTQATPTLKIRLPRIGAFQSTVAPAAEAPAKAARGGRAGRRSQPSLHSSSVSDTGSSSRVNDSGGLSASSPNESC